VAPIGLTKVHAQPIGIFATNSQVPYRAGTDHQKIAKIDRENEVAPPPKVSASVGKVQSFHVCSWSNFFYYGFTQAIQQARMEKGLSQKDCAQKINEKPSVLQDYESGKAIPNAQILSKLERLLGVKLRGTSLLPRLYHITHDGCQVLILERSWRGRRSRRPGPSMAATTYLQLPPSQPHSQYAVYTILILIYNTGP